MDIRSYPKVYNLGHAAIADLFEESVLVEEKIDGSQFSFGVYDGELCCRSRGIQLGLDAPEKMFIKAIETAKELFPVLNAGWTYRGEFLSKPKHNTLAYDRVPEKNIIIFDIDTGDQSYLAYEKKLAEAKRLRLECVPILYKGKVESYEKFKGLLEMGSCLGGQKIEGMVFKNYLRFGRDGKTLMGKYVSERFKEVHRKDWKERNPGGKDIIGQLTLEYRSEVRWDKAIQHLKERGEYTGTPKDIGPLFKEVSTDVQKECGEEIAEKLFKWAWKDIGRGVTRGLPEWYKEKLAKSQFKQEAEDSL